MFCIFLPPSLGLILLGSTLSPPLPFTFFTSGVIYKLDPRVGLRTKREFDCRWGRYSHQLTSGCDSSINHPTMYYSSWKRNEHFLHHISSEQHVEPWQSLARDSATLYSHLSMFFRKGGYWCNGGTTHEPWTQSSLSLFPGQAAINLFNQCPEKNYMI